MAQDITMKKLLELLEFGERVEQEINRRFPTPYPKNPRPHRSPRRIIPRQSHLGRKPAKN